MRDNFGGSWMDEFYKIAEEKGWVVKKAISHSEMEKVWGGLPKEIKDRIIPGWDNMTFADLIGKVEFKWGPILMEYRKQQTPPKGDVSIDPEKVKVTPQEKPAKRSLSPQLIAKVQALIMKKTGLPVSNPKGKFLGAPDGFWGPRSAVAWNKYVETLTTPGGPLVVDTVAEDGSELPRMNDIRYVFNRESRAKTTMGPISVEKADDITSEAKDPYADFAEKMPKLSPEDFKNVRTPTQEKVLSKNKQVPEKQPGDIVVQQDDWRRKYNVRGIPSDITEGEHLSAMRLLRQQGHRGPVKDRNQYMQAIKQVRESRKMRAQEPKPFVPKIPEWAKSNDGVVASIANELISLATDLENLGEEKAAVAVDHHLKLYTEAANKLYDITGETGEQLIDQAHPGGGPTLVPAAEEGGKVETIVEDQKKNIQKTLKQPTGKYAEVMAKLIATANKLDEEGNVEAAKIVDKTIKELRDSHPFVNRSSVFEATGSKDTKASMEKEAVDVQNFDQILELRTVLAKLAKTLDDLEGEVQDQSASEVHKNIGINIFEVINDKERYDEARTKYSVPGVAGPFSYKYDDAVTKMRKTVQAWSRQLTGWPTKKNHAEWILQTLGKWEKTLGIIKKYYDTFPDDNVSGNWDNSFNLKYERAKEDLKKISNIYERVHGKSLQRTRPKTTIKTDKPGKSKTTKKPSDYKSQYEAVVQKRLKARLLEYVGVLDEFAKFLISNDKALKEKLGKPKFNTLLEWASKQKYNVQSKPDYRHYVKLTDKSVGNLRNYLSKLKSVVKSASIKTAEDVPGVSLPGGKSEKSKSTGKRYRKPPKDPDIEKLQQAMMKMRLNLGPKKDDGRWGKFTSAAWNKLSSKLPQANLGVTNPKTVPDKNTIRRATRFANSLAERIKLDTTKFNLAGKEFNLSDFSSVRNYLASLARNYRLNRENMHDNEYITEVIDHSRKIYASLQGNGGKFINNYYGEQTLKVLKSNFVQILRQMKKYGLPSKKETELPGFPSKKKTAPGDKSSLPGYGLGREKDEDKFKELTTKSTPIEIYRAIASLPGKGIMRTPYRFKVRALAVIPKTVRDRPRKYWNDLNARIIKIDRALSAKKNEIKTELGKSKYTEMVDALDIFISEHRYIGKKLGYL